MKRSILVTLVLLLLLCGCDRENKEYFEGLTSNSDISLDSEAFPLGVSVIADYMGYSTTIESLVTNSDMVAVGTVKSISPANHCRPYHVEGLGKLIDYINYFSTDYEFEITEVIKGDHRSGETVIFTYRTDNVNLSWYLYDKTIGKIETGQEYVIFMGCYENPYTDMQHYPVDIHNSVHIISDDSFTIENIRDQSVEVTLPQLREIAAVSPAAPHTVGDGIEEYFGDPMNYMCELSDTDVYADETELVNTSDDIVMGRIIETEDFSGELCFFNGEKTRQGGYIVTLRISETLKGSHKKGDKIRIFIREDADKDELLHKRYEKGIDAVFFLACMDGLSDCHLNIAELQASIVLDNGTVYNRANCSERALRIGYAVTDRGTYYRILFPDCFTYKQLSENILSRVIALPDRIIYGEYCCLGQEEK